jgi:hypothetical protein
MLAEIFVQDDTLENWKHGQIPPHNYLGSLYFCNPILLCVMQDQFRAHSTPRTAFSQEEKDDEDMIPMYMTMIGPSHGKGVQQGCPSKE